MRILGGLIEIGRDRPVTCGCGRPAVGGGQHCTLCKNAIAADMARDAKAGRRTSAQGWTPCPTGDGGKVRNGVCPVAGCSVGVRSSRR